MLAELLLELLEIGGFAVGTVVLSAVGVYLEELSIETVAAGQPKLALWLAAMGALAFYFGPYLMGYTELRPRLARLRNA